MCKLNKDNFGVLEYNYWFYDIDKSLKDVYMISMTFTYRGIVQHFIKREEDTDIGFIRNVLSVIDDSGIDYLFTHFLKGFVDLLNNIADYNNVDVSCMTPLRDPKIDIVDSCGMLPLELKQYRYNVKLFNNVKCMDMISYVHKIKPLEYVTLNCIVKTVLGKELLNRDYRKHISNLIENSYIISANEVSDALSQVDVINKLLSDNDEQLTFDKKQLSIMLAVYRNSSVNEPEYNIMYVFKDKDLITTNYALNLEYLSKGINSVIRHSIRNILSVGNISFKDTTVYVKDECFLEDAKILVIIGVKRFVYTHITGCDKGIEYLKDNGVDVSHIQMD